MNLQTKNETQRSNNKKIKPDQNSKTSTLGWIAVAVAVVPTADIYYIWRNTVYIRILIQNAANSNSKTFLSEYLTRNASTAIRCECVVYANRTAEKYVA